MSSATERCSRLGFRRGYTCRLPLGHEGLHDYGFLPDTQAAKATPARKPIAWSIEENHRKGVFDVFIDRRAGAYDLDLAGAMAFVQNHRSFKSGDQVTVVDQQGQPVQVG